MHFKQDMLKDGGEYITTESKLKRIDDTGTKLILEENQTILIEDIYSMNICK